MNAEMLSGNGSRNWAGFPSPHRMPVKQTVNHTILTNRFMMIVIFVAIGYGIPLHTTAEFGNCHKMISLRPPDFLPVKFRKTEMAPNFHDFAAVKMLRSLPPFSIMDAPRTHPIPRLGEMGMFHVCGKNPSRDIIFQLICFRNLRRFIRTIPGMPWIEIRTGRHRALVPLNNSDIF